MFVKIIFIVRLRMCDKIKNISRHSFFSIVAVASGGGKNVYITAFLLF